MKNASIRWKLLLLAAVAVLTLVVMGGFSALLLIYYSAHLSAITVTSLLSPNAMVGTCQRSTWRTDGRNLLQLVSG